MKILNIIFLSLIFLSTNTLAFDDQLYLSAGFGFSKGSIKSKYLIQRDDDEDEIEDETEIPAFGLNSRFGYRNYPVELGFLSDIGFGQAKNIRFNDPLNTTPNQNGSLIVGDGHYRIVTISPYFKHNLKWSYQVWNPYLGLGPTWSLSTLVLSNVSNGANFNTKKRISFENFGAGIFIGVEEILSEKSMNPTFIELGFTYMASYKVSVIDASDFKEVRTLSSRKARDFQGSFFFLRVGVVLF